MRTSAEQASAAVRLQGKPSLSEEDVTVYRDVSLARILTVLLEGRMLLIGIPVVLATVVLGVALLLPRTYTTSVSFVPSATTSAGGQLSGLAAQFGVTLSGGSEETSPQFYADLIKTTQFLVPVASTKFSVPNGADTLQGTVADIYGIDEGTPTGTLAEAVRKLQDEVLDVTANQKTSVIRISVKTRWPLFSKQLAARVLDYLNAFNRERHQRQFDAERHFMDERLTATKDELRAAENELQEFLERNRAYQGDPRLMFQFQRLQRVVEMRSTVYSTLMQSFEQARLEAARNTPTISVVEQPTAPLRPDRRRLVLRLLLSVIAGGILATCFILGRAAVLQSPAAELQALRVSADEIRTALLSRMRRSGRRERNAAG